MPHLHHEPCALNSSSLTQDAIQAVRLLLKTRLTDNQQLVLSRLSEHAGRTLNMTSLGWKLSSELELSEPTVRRTIQLARELGMVDCGDCYSKGESVQLTPLGEQVLAGFMVKDNGGDEPNNGHD